MKTVREITLPHEQEVEITDEMDQLWAELRVATGERKREIQERLSYLEGLFFEEVK